MKRAPKRYLVDETAEELNALYFKDANAAVTAAFEAFERAKRRAEAMQPNRSREQQIRGTR